MRAHHHRQLLQLLLDKLRQRIPCTVLFNFPGWQCRQSKHHSTTICGRRRRPCKHMHSLFNLRGSHQLLLHAVWRVRCPGSSLAFLALSILGLASITAAERRSNANNNAAATTPTTVMATRVPYPRLLARPWPPRYDEARNACVCGQENGLVGARIVIYNVETASKPDSIVCDRKVHAAPRLTSCFASSSFNNNNSEMRSLVPRAHRLSSHPLRSMSWPQAFQFPQ